MSTQKIRGVDLSLKYTPDNPEEDAIVEWYPLGGGEVETEFYPERAPDEHLKKAKQILNPE